ncbi:acyltransferase domain-containing protein [Baekduia soli]|uniref:Acyltransferase domain-containing protein n=1 Tax=Baekduia soli TaxID=496014 RepID=A0A5B8U5C8_9ACTN|nr:type I polyketide synthase [Baekduia soli]QEC48329.1 acyltransferase domain-containing protein [Baekduia soli]
MTAAAASVPGGIAITGMACLFPGAPGLDAYWRNILSGTDAVTDPPPESWDPDVYYDPEFRDQDRTYCKRGGYLGSLASFAPLAHGIPPVDVGGEPDQWLALQVATDALADAGATELPQHVRERTSVVLGKGTYLNGGNAIAVQRGLVVGQTIELIRRLHPEHTEAELEALRRELQGQLPPLGPETVPGLIPNIIVGRIANRLDLRGPSYTVDGACASSLLAVRLAMRDLRSGECDLALAGGAQVWMPVATLNLFCRLGALSRTQQIRPFDEHADGTLLGEGIGMIVLKRLEDARRDGDRVYAVLRGAGASSDGRGTTVMAPRVEGEELALRRAYDDAGVSPRSVGLIEAHGTGTPVGDVVELEALTRVFGARDALLPRCAIGTVKSMISHTIPAAGVAGIIKTALALHHRVLPPTLHCETPNPKLGLEQSPFYINTETRPWIHGGAEPRRAGVNAFGFGGANAHVVLEEVPGTPGADHRPPWDSELCVLERATQAELADAARGLAVAVAAAPELGLTDLAFTLAGELGTVDAPLRLAVVATSVEDLRGKLLQAAEKLADPACRRIKSVSGIYYAAQPLGREGKVALVFPGEGAQYPGMLADLCLHFPQARETFDRIDRLYADHPRGHLLSDWVYPRPALSDEERARNDAQLMELDIAVESVLTANAALHAVMSGLLRRVDATVGHSTGEHSAAMVAGALDLDTDERLGGFCRGLNDAYAAADERHDVPRAVLLALGADAAKAAEIAAAAGGELHLAMDNCPHQVVLVGEREAVARAHALASADGIVAEQLPYDRAVHTPMFEPFAEDLRKVFAGLPVRRPHTALYSCTTAARCPEEPEEIRTLLGEHWTSAVRFRETIEALYADGVRVFVEAGPRGNMTSFIEDTLRGRPSVAVACDVRRRSGTAQLNHVCGLLAVHDADVDVAALFAGRGAREVDWRAPTASEGRPPAPRIALSTRWPMLALSEEDGARLGARAPAAPAPPAPVANGNGNGHHAAPAPVAAPAPAAAVLEPAPAWDAPLPVGGDEVTAAVAEHLATMERFLHAGSEVMHAYLAGAAGAAGAALPLLGEVVACDPGVELRARRLVDPEHDRYLLHHTLGRAVARTDPDLAALAVMPMAMSLELMAEAAAALVPGRIVTGLRDVRAHRWLAWADAPRTLELTARRLPAADADADAVRVELRDPDADGEGGAPVVEGTVLLAGAHPVRPAPLAAALAGAGPGDCPPERLYEDVMFHGPLWQGVRAMDLVGPAAARARLEVLPQDGLLRGDPAPALVLDPVALDAAGQVIGFWAAQQLHRGRVVFPFRLAALDLFGPRPADGTALDCVAAIATEGDALVRSDIEVADAEGGCWMRLTGWEDRRFDVPDRFAPLTVPGALAPLSTQWATPVSALGLPAAACRRIDARLPADAALWKPVWARRVLGRGERERFDALRGPERRQLEWLGARTAAKEAVAGLLADGTGLELQPADLEIAADELGAPRVACPALDGLEVEPVVSLAHTGGHAFGLALLAPRGAGARIGIDVELVRPRPEGFAEAALRDGERALLGGVAPQDADEWVLRCWCAKEAAGKATGIGVVTGDEGSPEVAGIDVASGTVVVRTAGREVVVPTRREDDLVVAVTIVTNEPEERR